MKIYRENGKVIVDGQNRLTLFDDNNIGNLYIDNTASRVIAKNFMMQHCSKRQSVIYTMRYFGFHTWSINIMRIILKFLR